MSVKQVVNPGNNLVDPTRTQGALLPRIRSGGEQRSPALLNSAALLTLCAASIHFAVAPLHLSEYVPYGVFFVCLGIAQVGLAVTILVAPRRSLFIAASIATIAVIGLWLASRTVGLPIAPVPWRPEAVGLSDVAATTLEAVAVIQFLLLIRRPRRPVRGGRIRVGLKMVPAFLLALLATYLGVGSGLAPMPVAYSAAPSVPGQPSTSVTDLVARYSHEPVESFYLTAAVTRIAGQEVWAYNGTVPGPELRVTQGDFVRITLINHLPRPTTIHWHGIRVPNAEDGVAGITQNAVLPGMAYTYDFVANDAGTFWYHSHQDTSNQLPRGLFGAIVVDPRGGVGQTRDYSLVIHGLPDGNSIAVNGSTNLHLYAAPGETVRLRLINAADVTSSFEFAPKTPVLLGAPYVVAALDGHDLNEPQQLGPERIPLGMGQRADLVFTMPKTGAVRLAGLSGAAPFFPFGSPAPTATVTIGSGAAPAAVNPASVPSFDFTRYGVRAPDPVADAKHFDVVTQLTLAGGPGFVNGSFGLHMINGQTSPHITPIQVREGDLVRLHITNNSRENHPIHIHGHIFSVLAKNGRPLTGSPVHLDAILVGPHETWDVGFLADNPGIWMLHCHVLGHAATGMSMTINYDGISTPFTMGSRSGNVPE